MIIGQNWGISLVFGGLQGVDYQANVAMSLGKSIVDRECPFKTAVCRLRVLGYEVCPPGSNPGAKVTSKQFRTFFNALRCILGITLLWDALEFTRQQKRVKKGHAPANPHNPRHAKILAEHPTATTLDLLKHLPSTLHDSR